MVVAEIGRPVRRLVAVIGVDVARERLEAAVKERQGIGRRLARHDRRISISVMADAPAAALSGARLWPFARRCKPSLCAPTHLRSAAFRLGSAGGADGD